MYQNKGLFLVPDFRKKGPYFGTKYKGNIAFFQFLVTDSRKKSPYFGTKKGPLFWYITVWIHHRHTLVLELVFCTPTLSISRHTTRSLSNNISIIDFTWGFIFHYLISYQRAAISTRVHLINPLTIVYQVLVKFAYVFWLFKYFFFEYFCLVNFGKSYFSWHRI